MASAAAPGGKAYATELLRRQLIGKGGEGGAKEHACHVVRPSTCLLLRLLLRLLRLLLLLLLRLILMF